MDRQLNISSRKGIGQPEELLPRTAARSLLNLLASA
jgi:hypothetical protein